MVFALRSPFRRKGTTVVEGAEPQHGTAARGWAQRISDHLAYGLLVYTGLQIFVTMKQLKEIDHSLLPYLALVVLVAAVIPGARAIEACWQAVPPGEQHDRAHAGRFARDRAVIWLVVVGLPFLLAGIARGVAAFTY